jgi:hypothetical protein
MQKQKKLTPDLSHEPQSVIPLMMTRAHLKMHIAGMRHSRVPAKVILSAAKAATGKAYKNNRKGWIEAEKDLTSKIDELKAAARAADTEE